MENGNTPVGAPGNTRGSTPGDCGAVREDGSVDYSVAVEAIGAAMNDEYLRNLVLRLVVERYLEILRERGSSEGRVFLPV